MRGRLPRDIRPFRRLAAGLVIAAAAGAAPARAADSPAPSEWEFTLTPYVWAPGIYGDVDLGPNIPSVHIAESIGDVLGHLKFAFMGAAGVRHDRLVGLADFDYSDLEATNHVGVRDPEFLNVRLRSKQLVAAALGGYRVVEGPAWTLDLLGGVRVVSADNKLGLEGPSRTLSESVSKTWADPVVGVRLQGPLAPRWSYTLYGDAGGFGAASRLTWQAFGLVNYAASRHWTVSGGWRHLSDDYSRDGFVYDVGLDGPVFAASYRF
jgi:hypothetical protein